jgi:hypothetical protein
MIVIALSTSAGAECWTATSPVYFCALPSAGAETYEWYDDTGRWLDTTTDHRTTLSCTGRLAVYAITKASGYNDSPPSQTSDHVYCTQPFGWDGDGNGAVNANDFGQGFVRAFVAGCKSCAVVNGVSQCGTCP